MTVAELIKALIDTGHLDYTVDAALPDGKADETASVVGITEVVQAVSGTAAGARTLGWVTLDLDGNP